MAQGNGSRGGGLALFLALLALAAVAVNFYADMRQDEGSAAILAQLQSATISPDIIKQTEQSVYYVEATSGMMATAFVVDRERGLLATNAHVAMNFQGPGSVKVISVDGTDLPVEAAFIHSGWEAFPKDVKSYEPALTFPVKVQDKTVHFPYPIRLPAAYDVGLLQVSMENAQQLAPDLPIASREDLLKLGGGDAIASIGYPGQLSATEGLDKIALTPKTTVGRIMAASSFMGAKLDDDSNRVIAQLILHPLHTQPGTSGSPMINDKGEVIAVNQGAFQRTAGSGEEAHIEEVGERVGHRADILLDLLNGDDIERIDNEYRPLWTQQLNKFERVPEAVVRLLGPFMSQPRDFAKATATTRDMQFVPNQPDPVYSMIQNNHALTTKIKIDPTRTNLIFATDFRGSIGFCNPAFQIRLSNGQIANGQPFQTKQIRIFRLEIPANYTTDTEIPAIFYEAAGCNSAGETMHVHVYSWAKDDILVADSGGWARNALASVRSFLKKSVDSALDYLEG